MDQPGPTAQGGSARIQVQICLPPTPSFFPPHHADPVKADTAERKVARWQASGIYSSCTTGMSSVMTQSSLPALNTEPCPHPTWAGPATCGGMNRKARAGAFSSPAVSSSVDVGSKRMGLETHPASTSFRDPRKAAGSAWVSAAASINRDDPLGLPVSQACWRGAQFDCMEGIRRLCVMSWT